MHTQEQLLGEFEGIVNSSTTTALVEQVEVYRLTKVLWGTHTGSRSDRRLKVTPWGHMINITLSRGRLELVDNSTMGTYQTWWKQAEVG